MSEEKTTQSHSRRHKHRRHRFSYSQNQLVKFVMRYKFQILTALLLVAALVAVIAVLISELFFTEEVLSAAQLLTRV